MTSTPAFHSPASVAQSAPAVANFEEAVIRRHSGEARLTGETFKVRFEYFDE